VGPDGAKWWLQFSGPEIRGEYNIKVDPTDAIPINPASKKQDAMEMARGYAEMNMGLVKQGMPAPEEIQRAFFAQFQGVDLDRLMAQMKGPSQQAAQQMSPGMNPAQPVPPEMAAQMMTQQRNK